MKTAVLTLCCCACAAMAAAQNRPQAGGGPRFQPRVQLQSAPPTALYAVRPQSEQGAVVFGKHAPQTRRIETGSPGGAPDVEIICGMRVIRKTADDDPKIVIKPDPVVRGAIRVIKPDVCTSKK